MEVQVYAKEIRYGFENDDVFKSVQQIAEKTVADIYKDEQDFQKEEYEAMLADGDVSNYEEYKEEVGISDKDVDYSKSFEENKTHPQITEQINEFTNKYMCNVMDLPQNAVVSIDDSFLDEKGKPDESAVRSAIKEKFGASATYIKEMSEASPDQILSQKAYDKVGEMIKSKDFQQFLDLRASIGKYSANNISMIFQQKPDSKAVMSYGSWTKLDRQVQAGESSIRVWSPVNKVLKNEKQVDKYIEQHPEEFGNPDSQKAIKAKDDFMKEIDEKGEAELLNGFRLVGVFDVSQTVSKDPEKDNIDEIINLDKPLNKDMTNYDDVAKSMKEAATLAPFSIKGSTSQQDALYEALCQYTDTLLKESPDKVTGIKSRKPMIGDSHKTETIMSAYLICKHIGIDCEEKASLKLAEVFNKDDLSEDFVKNGKRGMFTNAFDRACKVSDQFNKEFDKSFGYDLEAQRNAIAEKNNAKEEELSKNRIMFGKYKMQKADEWKSGSNTFVIAKSEANGTYYAQKFEGKKGVYVKDENGKFATFDNPPSRAEIEDLYEKNNVSQSKTTSKPKSEKKAKKQKDVEHDD